MSRPPLSDLVAGLTQRDRTDPYRWIHDATDQHRAQHGCWAYPYQDGSILGALRDALRPIRVLELGTALGYTACWWAAGGARVDTLEADPVHVQLARDMIAQAAPWGVVTVRQGEFADLMPELDSTYDLAFFDGYAPPPDLLPTIATRLAPDGTLVATNLDLFGGGFRADLSTNPAWHAAFVEDLAVARRR